MKRLAVAVALVVFGCGSQTDPPTSSPCEWPTVAAGDRCVPHFDPCGDDQVPILGGGCLKVGIARCAEGFVTDGAGCAPVLPATSCPTGTLAVPGDDSCREIAPCGAAPFGTAEADASTIFVDASASAGGDGTSAKPFRTISEAIAAAKPGGSIAVAEGSYVEALAIDKELSISGRCPSKVEIVAPDGSLPAIAITARTTIAGVAVRGPSWGISTSGELTLERVWIHDTARSGLEVYATTRIRESLFEANAESAIYVEGAEATIERVAIRDVAPSGKGKAGNGIHAEIQADPLVPAHVTVKQSLVERATEAGIASLASKVEIFGTVVRDTRPRPADGKLGAGLYAANDPKSGTRGALLVDGSFIARNHRANVYLLGADGTLTDTVVRDGLPRMAGGAYGNGIEVSSSGTLSITTSLVDANRYAGIALFGAKGVVERTIVRGTETATDGSWGAGVVSWEDSGTPADVTVRRSRIEGNHQSGVAVGGSTMSVEGSAILATKPSHEGTLFGDGVVVTTLREGDREMSGSAAVLSSIVDGNARAGALAVGASLQLGASAFRCNGFDIEVEDVYGHSTTGDAWSHPVDATPTEPLACGCGTALAGCRAQSSHLDPVEAPVHAVP